MSRVAQNQRPDKHFEAFTYRASDLSEVHRCSVPNTAQESVDYISFVERVFGEKVDYIEGRLPGTLDYEPIRWEIVDDSTGERTPFVPTLLRSS